jgi:ABC-2 type transport system permease protein
MNAATIRSYLLESRFELLRLARRPSYLLPTILFPVMFYIFFGLIMGRTERAGGMSLSTYLLGTYGAFGAIGASLFGIGISLASDRGFGWLVQKRASPMHTSSYLLAKVVAGVLFGAVVCSALFALGVAFGGVRMPLDTWLHLGAILVAGTIPFCALGLAIGAFAKPDSAPGVVNTIYLPMSFLAGLWLPIDMLPQAIQRIAPALPTYHFAQLALGAIGYADGGATVVHVAYLAVFTAVALAAAAYGLGHDEHVPA